MNTKEYLITNSSPLLDNPKNIFILEWLEANTFCTPLDISKSTKISLTEVNEILQILYKNSLVSFTNEKYKITFNGIKILNKMGLSDLQIKKLLSLTKFKSKELALYQSIFETWRTEFLDTYLFFFYVLDKEYDNTLQAYSNNASCLSEIPNKETYTIFIATMLHDFGSIMYSNETSRLMAYYTNLYEYSLYNYCFSSEIYHHRSDYWEPDTIRSNFSKYISIHLKNKLHSYTRSKEKKFHIENFNLSKFYRHNTLNDDFDLYYKILTDNTLLNNIINSNTLSDLSISLHLSETQTKFVLKSIRTKINTLLLEENTSLTSYQ